MGNTFRDSNNAIVHVGIVGQGRSQSIHKTIMELCNMKDAPEIVLNDGVTERVVRPVSISPTRLAFISNMATANELAEKYFGTDPDKAMQQAIDNLRKHYGVGEYHHVIDTTR